jgi:hypothetical protein
MYKPDFAKLTCPIGLSFAKSRYVPVTKDGRYCLSCTALRGYLLPARGLMLSVRTLKSSYINIEVPEAS